MWKSDNCGSCFVWRAFNVSKQPFWFVYINFLGKLEGEYVGIIILRMFPVVRNNNKLDDYSTYFSTKWNLLELFL